MNTAVSKLAKGLVAAACIAASLSLVACGPGAPKMKKFNIGIGQSTNQKVEVDLVCVPDNATDLAIWRTKNLDDYFSGNDPLRSSNTEITRSFTFSEGASNKIVITPGDEIWKKWFDKRPILFVLANSRGLRAEAQKNPGNDIRRTEIPLTTEYWKDYKFEINISNGGAIVTPPPTKITK